MTGRDTGTCANVYTYTVYLMSIKRIDLGLRYLGICI